MRPRDLAVEREVARIAAQAAGLSDDRGLRAFAHLRALPGGVRVDMDGIRETAEELADGFNYIAWSLEPLYARYLAGDPDVLDHWERLMTTLQHLVKAWDALSPGPHVTNHPTRSEQA